jgi:hypothetical protein
MRCARKGNNISLYAITWTDVMVYNISVFERYHQEFTLAITGLRIVFPCPFQLWTRIIVSLSHTPICLMARNIQRHLPASRWLIKMILSPWK